jgi:hypothetical protein
MRALWSATMVTFAMERFGRPCEDRGMFIFDQFNAISDQADRLQPFQTYSKLPIYVRPRLAYNML